MRCAERGSALTIVSVRLAAAVRVASSASASESDEPANGPAPKRRPASGRSWISVGSAGADSAAGAAGGAAGGGERVLKFAIIPAHGVRLPSLY